MFVLLGRKTSLQHVIIHDSELLSAFQKTFTVPVINASLVLELIMNQLVL
jgi:hypothetical protein